MKEYSVARKLSLTALFGAALLWQAALFAAPVEVVNAEVIMYENTGFAIID